MPILHQRLVEFAATFFHRSHVAVFLLHLLSQLKGKPQTNRKISGEGLSSHRYYRSIVDGIILKNGNISGTPTDIR